ncbi:TetR/AcrR family transcriptional regulator [Phytomonospora sp. NPDC050363]|uniref:TetR/AcrR family transcriptional regulator n=1 Tax=Phytomonospora sp. NPDC050363 TaxID=3155642 RepID=UPI0033E4DC93
MTTAQVPLGRGPKVRAAVLAATIAELAETGYAELTVEAVAKRAGVHKTTVYRRWTDRETLVADALKDHVAADLPVPDTGTLDGDLRELARALVAWLSGPTGAAVATTMVADRVPGVAEIKHRFFADRLARGEIVVRRALERGELPPGTDPAEVLKTLIAPIYLRLFVTAETLDDELADRAARITLAAARSGAIQ